MIVLRILYLLNILEILDIVLLDLNYSVNEKGVFIEYSLTD